MATNKAMRTIKELGWDWRDNGVLLAVAFQNGQEAEVFVPLRDVQVVFGQELAAVGCDVRGGVGASTAVGFLGSLRKAYRSVKKSVRKVVPKAIRRAASKVHRLASIPHRYATRYTRKFGRPAARFFRSPMGATVLSAATAAFPVIAPVTGGIYAASHAFEKVDKGVRMAERIKRGIQRPTRAARQVMEEGRVMQRAVNANLQRARMGDRRAQQFAGAVMQVARHTQGMSPLRFNQSRAASGPARQFARPFTPRRMRPMYGGRGFGRPGFDPMQQFWG